LATDLVRLYRLVTIGECRIARNNEHVGNARQINCHIVANRVSEVLLVGIIAEIKERQYDNRKARRRKTFRLAVGVLLLNLPYEANPPRR
jgi:hypothetical protein